MACSYLEKFVYETDAQSRVTIWMTNHANKGQIARAGDFSHDTRYGLVFGDGKITVNVDTGAVNVLPDSGLMQNPLEPMAFHWAPPQQLVPGIPQIRPFSPYDIPELLRTIDCRYDFISKCNHLNLYEKDFDSINDKDGIFIRSFRDEQVLLPNCIPLPTYDHLDSFSRMYVLSDEAVFELKTFKFMDRRRPYQFRFKPEHPGIWCRDGVSSLGRTIILDTDISAVFNRTSPANNGLIYVGDIAKIDWELLRNHEILYVWRPGGRDHQSRIRFEKALRFLTEAKKHGIYVSLITLQNEHLDIPAVIVQARCFGLDIPATLKETGYVQTMMPQEEFVPVDIPVFWSKGSATLFFGLGYGLIMEKLMRVFSRNHQDVQTSLSVPDADHEDAGDRYVFPQKQIGILYPPPVATRVKKIIARTGLEIPSINSAISMDALETALFQHGIQVLFIVYAEKIPSYELADILDLCGRIGVVVGLFSGTEGKNGKPIPEDVLSAATKELVAQSYKVTVDDDDVIGRNATTGTVKRYHFEDDGKVSVTEHNNRKKTNTEEFEL